MYSRVGSLTILTDVPLLKHKCQFPCINAGVPKLQAPAHHWVSAHLELGSVSGGRVHTHACSFTYMSRCSHSHFHLRKQWACMPTFCTNGVVHACVHACRISSLPPSQERLGTAALMHKDKRQGNFKESAVPPPPQQKQRHNLIHLDNMVLGIVLPMVDETQSES